MPSTKPTRRTNTKGDPDRVTEAAWPSGLPYTGYFPADEGQARAADLEHPAPVPRVGEVIEYIDERGRCERYVVREVVHTLQTSASVRPSVESESRAATAIARGSGQRAETAGDGGELRAGLPKVFLDRLSEESA
jgi:hypothetical protein